MINFQDKIKRLDKKLVKVERKLFLKYDKLVAERQAIIDAVETIICKKGESRLIKVGSLSNHLADDTSSDIDLSFLPYDTKFLEDFHNFADFRK
jgi:hypothetical protein